MSRKPEVSVVLGAQWGDEGKGKIVDVLACDVDLVCRCQGGSNAGHTVIVGENEYKFQLIPSGITNPKIKVLIGNGVVLHIPTLMREVESNSKKGISTMKERIVISDRTHLVFDMHQQVDGLIEALRNKNSIGTTKRGIGPTYASKALRNGIRVADLMGDFSLFEEKFKRLAEYHKMIFPDMEIPIEEELTRYKQYASDIREMVQDTVVTLNDELKNGKKILIEGANASMLDIDFGTYPYVTSSNCGVGGACTGLGLPAQRINEVYGVVKAYTTRVGAGILPTELLDATGEHLQTVGGEFGTVTGRSRRCGWLDLVVVKYTHMLNGYTAIALTKIDVLDDLDEVKVAVAYKIGDRTLPTFPADLNTLEKIQVVYETLPGWKTNLQNIRKREDLPPNALKYIQFIESYLDVPVKWVSVGKSRDAIITLC